MQNWFKVATPPHKKTNLVITCLHEGGHTGRYKLEAHAGDSLVHQSCFSWNKWLGHCHGRLLINAFVSSAELKAVSGQLTQ